MKHKSFLVTWLVFLSLLVSHALADELWQSELGRERVFNALVEVFRDNYWNPTYIDWDVWAASHHDEAVGSSSRSSFDNALRRMVGDLGDDHSRFVGAPVSVSDPAQLNSREPGLGFRHGFLPGTGLVVERVFPDTPAAAAGLRRGDVVLRVNGQDIRTATSADGRLRDAVAAGDVQLGLRRKTQFLTVTATPAPVAFERVQDLPQGEMLDATTGYLYIPSFRSETTAEEVHRLVKELAEQGATSLVLDLRDNLGGRLGELGKVLGAFIEGPWAEAVSHDTVVWRSSYRLDKGRGLSVLETLDGAPFTSEVLSEPTRFSGPLAVIVSRYNSSAGEIAPLVLQELGRAVIVGEQTEGNVEAIQGFDLPDGSLVYVAVANLQGVGGFDFTKGVTPEVIVTDDLTELSRGFDAPVAEALRTLKGLPFTPGKFF